MALTDLIGMLVEDFSIQEDQLSLDRNRYNRDLGTIKISKQLPQEEVNSSLSRFYNALGFSSHQLDGFYSYSRDREFFLSEVKINGQETTISIARNHLFDLTL
ncbi:hypothetical protein COU57_03370 [Candidatus Pacearchaeota archaeon CG10_big_fil_rev_8_21_14_0_10_32_14]|nr:MAG: hypothetical protein COU57_03370 [Candidatus Pacearchaeota archaeon CG10_big_fil_rev_8_21_14_0_10_32_14]